MLLWVSAASLAPLEVSGALSRAAAVFAHLEWLLVLCASGLFPTPISFCSFLCLFPAQLRSRPSAPPWAPSTALQPGTALLPSPKTCLWRTCFLQGCNEFPALQVSAGPNGCQAARVGRWSFPVPLHLAGQRCCLHEWCTAEHFCCHCTGGLCCTQKLPQLSQKTPTLYIENAQMIY